MSRDFLDELWEALEGNEKIEELGTNLFTEIRKIYVKTLTREWEDRISRLGYDTGYKCGYDNGRRAGFEEGLEEGRCSTGFQRPDPLA